MEAAMLSQTTTSPGRRFLEGDIRPSMEDVAHWACEALIGGGAGSLSAGPPASFASDMATVALFLQLSFGQPRNDALSLACREMVSERELTPASAKKNRSEARAILEFGLGEFIPSHVPSSEHPLDLLRDLAARIRALRMADVRKLRSDRLQGAKGGRPVSRSMRVLAMVRRLRAEAANDDQAAQEFEAILTELTH